MICHVVLIRLKQEETEKHQWVLDQAREILTTVPGVKNLRVGEGIKADTTHPIGLVMDFDDEVALQAYQVHPAHRRFVEEIIGPVLDDKKVYDYKT